MTRYEWQRKHDRFAVSVYSRHTLRAIPNAPMRPKGCAGDATKS